jgi:hypothetical protein
MALLNGKSSFYRTSILLWFSVSLAGQMLVPLRITTADRISIHLCGNSSGNSKLMLRENWKIQSSAKVQAGGDVLSSTQFTPKAWYPTSVPTTVLNALIENKVYPDPYFGMNLRSIPGTQYPIGENFSNLPMPPDSPFRVP